MFSHVSGFASKITVASVRAVPVFSAGRLESIQSYTVATPWWQYSTANIWRQSEFFLQEHPS